MAELDVGNLYDMNKQILNLSEPLPRTKLKWGYVHIREFMESKPDKYFMLLNRETYNFTLLNLGDKSISSITRVMDQFETCLSNRGSILSIEKTKDGNAYEIWIRDENNDVLVYYLFPYDLGVIE